MKYSTLALLTAGSVLAGIHAANAQEVYSTTTTYSQPVPVVAPAPAPVASTTVVAPATVTVPAGVPTTVTQTYSTTAPAVVSETTYYTLPAMGLTQPMTLGQYLAAQIDNPSLSNFKSALQGAVLSGNFDPNRGFTIFAPVNSAFNSEDIRNKPLEAYIVNDRIGLNTIHGTWDTATTISGDRITVSRQGQEFFFNDIRISNIDSTPYGVIYSVGGHTPSGHVAALARSSTASRK